MKAIAQASANGIENRHVEVDTEQLEWAVCRLFAFTA